jgi:hypothetical protein
LPPGRERDPACPFASKGARQQPMCLCRAPFSLPKSGKKGAVTKKQLPFPANTRAAVARIISLLDKSRASTGYHTYEHFRRALSIWEAALRRVKMRDWLEVTAGMEFGLAGLSEALAILIEQATLNYEDLLGNVYMQIGQGDRRFGQFFTPWGVAHMMAEITIGEIKPREPGQPPMRVLEPTVGSGVLILAAAEVIEERCPGAILRGDVEFVGIDIDPLCCTMCRINMWIHGIVSLIKQEDELSEEEFKTLEGVLGYKSGRPLLRGPVIHQGNFLELFATEASRPPPRASKERPAERASKPGNERSGAQPLISDERADSPALVAQDLWAPAALETSSQAAGGEGQRSSLTSSRRRKRGNGTSEQAAEYSPVELFPLSSDDSPP